MLYHSIQIWASTTGSRSPFCVAVTVQQVVIVVDVCLLQFVEAAWADELGIGVRWPGSGWFSLPHIRWAAIYCLRRSWQTTQFCSSMLLLYIYWFFGTGITFEKFLKSFLLQRDLPRALYPFNYSPKDYVTNIGQHIGRLCALFQRDATPHNIEATVLSSCEKTLSVAQIYNTNEKKLSH